LTVQTQYSVTWPTTVGACCIVVGGLTLFGGCLAFTGLAEIEQLHTAIPFGEGEISDELTKQLDATAPRVWISSIASVCNIIFSLFLIYAGMSLLKRIPKASIHLIVWSVLYILFKIASVALNWFPRLSLVQENSEVQGMFLAQLMISMPLYLVLPVFLLIYLNKKHVRNEISLWR